jgi:hypothetical protein
MKNKNLYILLKKSKWAGWFDLYNKALYEELCPFQEIGKDMDLGIGIH